MDLCDRPHLKAIVIFQLNQWFANERTLLDTYQENLFHATRGATIKKCGNSKVSHSSFLLSDSHSSIVCSVLHFSNREAIELLVSSVHIVVLLNASNVSEK